MSNDDADRRQDLGLPWLPAEPEPAAHRCRGGWLPDDAGRAVPCLRCKSHLRAAMLPDGRATWTATR
jgi:hypothetical protein